MLTNSIGFDKSSRTNRWTYFKGSNPCPVCGDTKGKCRTKDGELILCMNAHEDAPGWHFIGDSKDGMWGMLVLDDRQWHGGEWKPAAKEKDPDRLIVSPQQYDQEWRAWLSQTRLQEHHLRDRGLSGPQIDRLMPFTRSLADGSVMAFPSIDGLLVGGQKRLDNPGDGGRYRWKYVRYDWYLGNSQFLNHRGEPENPLACWVPGRTLPGETTTDVPHLIEGTTFKPAIAAVRFGLPVIGAAGGLHHSSPQTLAHSLQTLKASRVVIVPDAGDAVNPNVVNTLRNKIEWLTANGYGVTVAWWGQFTKDANDIDELDSLIGIRYLTPDQFWAVIQQPASPRSDLLATIHDKVFKLFHKAPRSKTIAAATTKAAATTHYYGEDQRMQVWQDVIKSGQYKYILDRSAPGQGKSHTLGLLDPRDIGLGKIFYLNPQHRNPTTETLEEWKDLQGRHNGLAREKRPNGETRLVHANGNPYSVAPNCCRTRVISALRDKAIPGSDTAGVICRVCPLKEPCQHSNEGHGFGFLHDRRITLAAARLRGHPDSLPSPTEFDFGQSLLAWEEVSETFTATKEITIAESDIADVLRAIAESGNDELYSVIDKLNALEGLFLGKTGMRFTMALNKALAALGWLSKSLRFLPLLQGILASLSRLASPAYREDFRYGIGHRDMAGMLSGVFDDIDLEALIAATTPSLDILNPTAKYGVDASDLSRDLRKRFADKDEALAETVANSFAKQWLPDLIQVLNGSKPGVLRLIKHFGKPVLTMTLLDERHRKSAKAANCNLFLDATIDRDDLALLLGCNPEEIYVCAQELPANANLRIRQIKDLGKLTQQRGNKQQTRLQALLQRIAKDDPNLGVIDFKKFTGESSDGVARGAWWKDSRSSNDFMDRTTLVLVGSPCENLGAAMAEWRLLSGTDPSDPAYGETNPEYEAWLQRRITATVVQAVGRSRYQRRPDEQITVWILTSADLSSLPYEVEQVDLVDYAPEIASDRDQRMLGCLAFIRDQLLKGLKPTQKQVSIATGTPYGTIKRWWKTLMDWLSMPDTPQDPGYASVPVVENPSPAHASAIAVERIVKDKGRADATKVQALTQVVFESGLTDDERREIWRILPKPTRLAIVTLLAWCQESPPPAPAPAVAPVTAGTWEVIY